MRQQVNLQIILSFLLIDQKLEMLEKQGSKYLRVLSNIQHQILNINFRNKFFQLTKSYTFTFSIPNIISDTSYQHIVLLSQQFYLFLLTKYLLGLLQSQQKIICDTKLLNTMQSPSESQKYMCLSNNRQSRKILGLSSRKNENGLGNNAKTEKSSSSINWGGRQQKKQQYHWVLKKLLIYQQGLNREYFNLTNSFKNKQRVAKIEIICFLMALISPDLICPIIEKLQDILIQKQKQIGEQTTTRDKDEKEESPIGMEQEIYLIFIYQTMSKLISPKVFSCLKKKFVKHTISNYEGVNSYTKIAKSLKYLRQILSQKEVLIKDRKQRAHQLERLKTNIYNGKTEASSKNQTKQNIRNFIKESLGGKQTKKYTQITNLSLKKQKQRFDNYKDRQKTKFHIYPAYLQIQKEKKQKNLLKAKQNNLLKCSNSVKDRLQLNVVKWRKQCHKKKYISNIQRTFYRLRYEDQEEKQQIQPPFKNFKSERNSYKFSKISINPNDNQNQSKEKKQDSFQNMKLKIDQFKRYAISDLQIINKFNSIRSKNRYFISSSQREVSILQHSHTNQKSNFQPEAIAKKDAKQILLINQKNECWNNLYNIRGDPFKSTQDENNLDLFKIGRNSNKLRKQRFNFNIACKNRAEVLEEDLNFMERISMKSK